MIGSIIPDQGCGLAPTLVLPVEDLNQVLKIEGHDLGVGVGLEQAQVLGAECIYCSYQGDSGPHHLLGQGVDEAFWPPTPPSKIRLP